MNFRDPESMNAIIGNVLRYGTILSAAVVLFGTILLANAYGTSDSSTFTIYLQNQVPHLQGFDSSLQSLLGGLGSFSAFAWIELGVILLIATPVSRVLISVFLFAAEKDRLYMMVTAVVLLLLLFSMLVTPFIPFFHA
jgi:uncharacterized membrane protein